MTNLFSRGLSFPQVHLCHVLIQTDRSGRIRVSRPRCPRSREARKAWDLAQSQGRGGVSTMPLGIWGLQRGAAGRHGARAWGWRGCRAGFRGHHLLLKVCTVCSTGGCCLRAWRGFGCSIYLGLAMYLHRAIDHCLHSSRHLCRRSTCITTFAHAVAVTNKVLYDRMA